MTDTGAVPNVHDDPHHARRWTILAVLAMSQLMIVLDATIVNVALPSVQADLGFARSSAQWIVTAYALAFGSLLLFGGRLGDLVGRKYIYMAGLIGFAVASAVGGTAGGFAQLVAARAAQGAFGAMLAPAALGLLTTTFVEPKERGKAFGIFGATAGGGAAIGLLLGGILTQYLSWRWCLYVNLFFAIPAAFAAWRLLHQVPHPNAPRVDWGGTFSATLGLLSIVYGLSEAHSKGWLVQSTLTYLGIGVLLLIAFAIFETRVEHPLLPPRVVLNRFRGGAYLSMGIGATGMFAVFIFLTYFMQQSLEFSPVRTGLGFLPMPITIITTSTIVATKLLPKIGPKRLIQFGMTVAALGMVGFAQIDTDTEWLTGVFPLLVVLGLGMGSMFATTFATGTLGVDRLDAGVASATLNTMQQVGGALGTAALTSVFAQAVKGFVEDHPGRSAHAAELAQIHGYTTAFWCSAVIFVIGLIVATIVIPRGVPDGLVAPGAAEPGAEEPGAAVPAPAGGH